jgi:hypothetical protein
MRKSLVWSIRPLLSALLLTILISTPAQSVEKQSPVSAVVAELATPSLQLVYLFGISYTVGKVYPLVGSGMRVCAIIMGAWLFVSSTYDDQSALLQA